MLNEKERKERKKRKDVRKNFLRKKKRNALIQRQAERKKFLSKCLSPSCFNTPHREELLQKLY